MQLPSWLVWYKKPEYRDIKEYATDISTGRRAFSPDRRGQMSVPSRLRLERILANKTCKSTNAPSWKPVLQLSKLTASLVIHPGSPMSLYDFYMYLKYIEFSPENLEFYVWFKNYEKTYAKLGISEKEEELRRASDAVPPSPRAMVEALGAQPSWDPELGADTLAHIARIISLNVAFSASQAEGVGEFTPPTPLCKNKEFCATNSSSEPAMSSPVSSVFSTNLGHSAELRAVVKTYLLPGAEKELNIPASIRNECLRALKLASDASNPDSGPVVHCHPDHLRPVADHVYLLLKNCSHRNFVRLGVSNGTYETVCVATTLGIVLTAVGFLLAVLRALQPHVGAHSRWNAFAPWPLWWVGMALILSGLRGSCFFLLLFSRRQPLPWERFDDDAGHDPSMQGSVELAGGGGVGGKKKRPRNRVLKAIGRLMIFDRKLRVKDPNLKRLQLKIVVQSLVSGAVFASLGVLLFLWLPVWTETAR